jgi:heavy metal efflux system protein
MITTNLLLYYHFGFLEKISQFLFPIKVIQVIACIFWFLPWNLFSQETQVKVLGLDEAVKMAITNHPLALNAELKVQRAQVLKSGGIQLEPTHMTYEYGNINSNINDYSVLISENFGSPITHIKRSKLYQNQITLSQINQKISLKQLTASVKEAYFDWVYQFAIHNLIKEEDSLYVEFLQIIKLNADSVKNDLLERTMAETRYSACQKKMFLSEESMKLAINNLNRNIFSEETFVPAQQELEMYAIHFSEIQGDKFYPYTFKELIAQQVNEKKTELELEQSRLFPEISAGYFNQKISPMKNLQGFQIGVSLPLWFFPASARIKEARINSDIAQNEAMRQTYNLEQTIDDLKIKLDQQFINISYYREEALKQADILIKTATQLLSREDIGYTEYLQSIAEAIQIKTGYLDSILQYNLLAVELEYYLN